MCLYNSVSVRVIALLVISFFCIHSYAQADGQTLLTNAVQVLKLETDEANKGVPVELNGIVTYSDQGMPALFVHDGTAGIFINPASKLREFSPGELLEIKGYSGAGEYAPVITNARINVIGDSPLPEPKTCSINEIHSGSMDSQWVRVQGTVRNISEAYGYLTIRIRDKTEDLQLWIKDFPKTNLMHMVGAEISVTGVCGPVFNKSRQLIRGLLFVTGMDNIHIITQAAPAFSTPIVSIDSILRYQYGRDMNKPYHIKGVVTAKVSDQNVYLKDDSGNIKVLLQTPETPEPGDIIEVTGFPVHGEYAPRLEDSLFKTVGHTDPPAPTPIDIFDIFDENHHSELVSIEGTLVSESLRPVLLPSNSSDWGLTNNLYLTLRSEDWLFNAELDRPNTNSIPILQTGSRLRLTGICDVSLYRDRSVTTCLILLDSAENIAVIQNPPWWNKHRIILALEILAACTVATLLWIGLLRFKIRRQAQTILNRARHEATIENMYQNVFSNAGDLIFTLAGDQRIISLNRAMETTIGLSASDIIGTYITSLMPQTTDHGEITRLLGSAAPHVSFEMQIQTPNGIHALEVNASLIDTPDTDHARQCIARDVTKQKQTDAALKQAYEELEQRIEERTKELAESNNRLQNNIAELRETENTLLYERRLYKAMMDNLPDFVYFKDKESRFISLNKAMANRFNTDNTSEIIGNTDFDLYSNTHATAAREDEVSILKTGTPIINKEEREIWKDGRVVWLSTSKMPLHDDAGNIIGTFGISKDITTKKIAETQIQRAKDELETRVAERTAELTRINAQLREEIQQREQAEAALRQSQKMEAIGQLAAGIAHDFNNLVTIIQGYTTLLLRSNLPDEDDQMALIEIHDASKRAADLTRQLLAFSRKQVLQPRPININHTIEFMIKMLRHLLSESISINFQPSKNLPAVKADASMMEQVILNLALNARDAMSEGGTLTITTAPEEIRDQQTESPGRFLKLTISDTGCGMDEQTLSRIFEPFFTTKEFGKGTGLGLATVYGIIKQHCGTIEVDSAPGKGTIFRVYLPAMDAPAPSPIETEELALPETGAESILVVEDEAPLRKLMTNMFTSLGYHAVSAYDGVKAIEVWNEYYHGFDVLVTDLVMPRGVSGRILAKRLRKDEPGLKVIFISGYSTEIEHSGIIPDADTVFLKKPFAMNDLAALIRKIVSK